MYAETREELVEKVEKSPANPAKIELGERFVSSGSLERLADVLGIPLTEPFNFGEPDRRKTQTRVKLESLLANQPEKHLALIHDIAA